MFAAKSARQTNCEIVRHQNSCYDRAHSSHCHFVWCALRRKSACGIQVDCGCDGCRRSDDFAFGTEESHGYLIGQYARDKDGAVACLLMAMLAAHLKSQGKSLHQRMAELEKQHGCHQESLVNVQMEGSEGMSLMKRLMEAFRTSPPKQLGGIAVAQVRDYKSLTILSAEGSKTKLDSTQPIW